MATNEQAIIETAERLLTETGQIPTVEAVRKALGGGSFSTISPVLREWRQQHQSASAVAGEIPARVRETLERASASLWSAFRDEVEERIARAREDADARAGEAEGERDQALAEVTRLETALTDATETAAREQAALTQALEDSQAALHEAQQTIATLTERTRQQAGRIEALSADITRAYADVDALRQQLSEQAGRFERELEQARAQAETLSQKLDGERTARQTEQARAAELAATLAREQEARGQAAHDAETLKTELAQTREQAKEREREQGKLLDAERQAHQATTETAAALNIENARLQERAGYVDELRAQVKALQARLTAPAHEHQPETPAKTPRTRKKSATPPAAR